MRIAGVLLAVVSIAAIIWFGLAPAATQPAPTVRATLSGYEETPAVSTEASGTFVVRVGDGVLDYELSYQGLQSGVLFAHIHFGQPGVAGGVSAFLCGGGGKPSCPTPGGTVMGTIVAANVVGPTGQGIGAEEFDELVRAILNGVAYANVHSTTFPGGEIRGQIRGTNFPAGK